MRAMNLVRALSVYPDGSRGDEIGQLRHVAEEELGAGRGQMRSFVKGHEMTGPDKTEHRHARGAPGSNARDAVLDHEAILRRNAHRARRVQKKIRTRFSLGDVGSGKNVGSKHRLVTNHPKREAQPLMPARGGDAHTRAQAFDSLPHALDPL